ncbi:MAG: glycine cleavage system protein T [Gammaproteobacteria bacterium]|nr:glycine cleavage system protein T [Gammaproteobacteria bacterium]
MNASSPPAGGTPKTPSTTAVTLPFQARIRKSAYFHASLKHGCHSFGVYNRTYISMGFQDPVKEYWDLLNGVVLWPVAGERQLEIKGPDASQFVQLLTPRNLDKFAVGQCKYLLVTADDGGIVNDPVCLKLGPDHYWLSAADSDIWLYARGINAMARMDVELSDPNVSVMQVQGPRSVDLMEKMFGPQVRTLKYYWCMESTLDDAPVVVSRTGWSSEWGYEIYLRDAAAGDRVFEHILAEGAEFGVQLGVVSQIRRIEGGMLSYGADMDLTTNPFEIGLGRLVDLEQSNDFIGRDALRSIAKAGAKRKIMGVSVPPPALSGFIEPWALEVNGDPVSTVTSLAFSPRLERNIGLTIVPTSLAEPGRAVSLVTPDGPVAGELQDLPFVSGRTG